MCWMTFCDDFSHWQWQPPAASDPDDVRKTPFFFLSMVSSKALPIQWYFDVFHFSLRHRFGKSFNQHHRKGKPTNKPKTENITISDFACHMQTAICFLRWTLRLSIFFAFGTLSSAQRARHLYWCRTKYRTINVSETKRSTTSKPDLHSQMKRNLASVFVRAQRLI